jgi:hypothetical protein
MLSERDHQRLFLEHTERFLTFLIEDQLPRHHRPEVIAVVGDELRLVRNNITTQNAYWESSEKLKELEGELAQVIANEKRQTNDTD